MAILPLGDPKECALTLSVFQSRRDSFSFRFQAPFGVNLEKLNQQNEFSPEQKSPPKESK